MPIQYSGNAESRSAERSVATAMWRGLLYRCPRCDSSGLFERYLKTRPVCRTCGLEFFHHRADDFPPYIVIVIVGHVIVGSMLALWNVWPVSTTLQYVFWPSLAIVLALVLLPSVKGAVVGLQWALGMHGFGQVAD